MFDSGQRAVGKAIAYRLLRTGDWVIISCGFERGEGNVLHEHGVSLVIWARFPVLAFDYLLTFGW
jgi:hypothetical protein